MGEVVRERSLSFRMLASTIARALLFAAVDDDPGAIVLALMETGWATGTGHSMNSFIALVET